MVGRNIVPGAMPQRPPDDGNPSLPHELTGILQMHKVLHLEGNVMQHGIGTGEEVDRVMIRVAAHEAEEIANPVRHAKTEHLLIKTHGAGDVAREERTVA